MSDDINHRFGRLAHIGNGIPMLFNSTEKEMKEPNDLRQPDDRPVVPTECEIHEAYVKQSEAELTALRKEYDEEVISHDIEERELKAKLEVARHQLSLARTGWDDANAALVRAVKLHRQEVAKIATLECENAQLKARA